MYKCKISAEIRSHSNFCSDVCLKYPLTYIRQVQFTGLCVAKTSNPKTSFSDGRCTLNVAKMKKITKQKEVIAHPHGIFAFIRQKNSEDNNGSSRTGPGYKFRQETKKSFHGRPISPSMYLMNSDCFLFSTPSSFEEESKNRNWTGTKRTNIQIRPKNFGGQQTPKGKWKERCIGTWRPGCRYACICMFVVYPRFYSCSFS